MNINFKNKKILVTGYNSDIGHQIILDFLKLGAYVFSTSSKQEFKEKKLTVLKCDFKKEDSVKSFLEYISKKKFDILVNNAGINNINKIYDLNENDFRDIIKVNLEIPARIIKVVSKNMIINKIEGRIINISSIFGSVSKSERCSYSSSKSGLNGLTRAVALDLAKYKVLVNSISPGFVNTKLTRRILGKKKMSIIKKEIPLSRLAVSKDISNLVIFLSSKENNYVTGQNLIIDGGFVIK